MWFHLFAISSLGYKNLLEAPVVLQIGETNGTDFAFIQKKKKIKEKKNLGSSMAESQ